MNIHGVVITANAMYTQTDTAEFITSRGGDYVFTVKLNQPRLRRHLQTPPSPEVPAHRTPEHAHGRTITRTIKAVEAPAGIEFPGARQVLQLRRTGLIAVTILRALDWQG